MGKEAKIKLYPDDLRKKSKKELLEMKKELKLALTRTGMWAIKRDKNISPKETKKNIARINTILKEKQKENGNPKNRDKQT